PMLCALDSSACRRLWGYDGPRLEKHLGASCVCSHCCWRGPPPTQQCHHRSRKPGSPAIFFWGALVSSRPPAINGSVPIDCAGEPKQCHPLSHLPRTSPATNRRPTLRPVMLLCFGCPVWLLVVPMYSALNLSRPRHYPHLL